KFGAYHEPFLGGGAFFFALYREGLISKGYLSDINAELIDAYTVVRDCTDELLARLATFRHTETFFYGLRAKNPRRMTLINRAARMIYLNKTCYNGLYRVNSKGQFNTPFGRYKNPTYRDPDNLYAVAQALSHIEIGRQPFDIVAENAKPGDFVYFDPPYVPLSATASFTAYYKDGFTHADQIRLRDMARDLSERGVYVMMSNSSAESVYDLYQEHFHLTEVLARRSINSNPEKRGKLPELLITSYPVSVPVLV
ncbi:MAG: DNA adenine methylase, partial [Candidatus Promineifilaceae bacterium]